MSPDEKRRSPCPDCDSSSHDSVSRRKFLQTVGGTVAIGAAGTALPGMRAALEAAPASSAVKKNGKPAETYVKMLYDTLTPEQKKIMHFPFDHKLRSFISNNWNVVDEEKGAIGKLYTPDQQEMIRKILQGILTEDGYERFQKQMKDDTGGRGFPAYTTALFGNPEGEKFEWVMTGRHLTLRADGNSVDNAAFGGPIFYGHAVEFNERPNHPGNVWWHQARLANKVFESLDGNQREKALLKDAPADSARTVKLNGKLAGLSGAELSGDQKEYLKKTLKSLMSMFRKSDVDEVVKYLELNGGVDSLSLSFYKEEDLGNDGVWDRWMVRGPAFVWYFRGSPHVHVWVNCAKGSAAGDHRVGRI